MFFDVILKYRILRNPLIITEIGDGGGICLANAIKSGFNKTADFA
jgi:hypothetical protein